MMTRIYLTFVLTILIVVNQFSQVLPKDTYTISNKKAIKYFKSAKKFMEVGNKQESEKLALKAIHIEPNFAEAYTLLAYIYSDKEQFDQAIIYFEKAIFCSDYFPTNYAQLGTICYGLAKYEKASQAFAKFLTYSRIDPDFKLRAEYLKKCADFSIEAVNNPKPFKPINAGAMINSANQEYFPTLTADNSTLYFTRNFLNQSNCSQQPGQEDFFITTRDKNGNWNSAVPFSEINSSCNEGAPCISANGQFMFFTSCADPRVDAGQAYGPDKQKGYGSCDIFYTDKISGKWTKPVNLGTTINSQNWETQPSFSSDGKTLYFVRGLIGRDRKHKGDIYCSTIGADNTFGEPVKLGPNINTDGDEQGVFIHPDNMTLYFGSSGRVGLGDFDLYMSKRQPDGEWGPAVNLGYPINTNKSENCLLVDPSGNVAYFASDREGGYGGLDIYSFEPPSEFRSEKLTYAKGLVYDSITRNPLQSKFELIDLETGKPLVSSFSNASGNFLITLNANKNYMVNVTKDNYLFYSNKFRMKEIITDYNNPFILNIAMMPIDTGNGGVLENIYFDVDKSTIRTESKSELFKLIQFLTNNPKIFIEISGHTDNVGDKNKNLILSESRAKAVIEYVVANSKVELSRLRFKGFGETKPRCKNDTEEHKQLNRRTEYKIIGALKSSLPVNNSLKKGLEKK